ncbi:MAG: threonylcarbamoyl-AMP synthase [Burkholderiales bacterium]|nr:threonylcarbamoyl-AMP synthase [Burkholderiales bacterium]
MARQPRPPRIEVATDESVTRAVERLRAGDLIGLPTETVYGLAADAGNADAVAKIFAAKGRPADHPLIVHVASAEAATAWAASWPAAAHRLATAFWPGPMTLIVRRAPHVLDAVTGGQDTVGLRVPSHPVAQAVLRAFSSSDTRPMGVAAPSANQFGQVSPTTAQHVAEEFPDQALLVLDGGASEVGVESTIIDVSGAVPRVLRPGRVRAGDIERVLGQPLADACADAPRVSGALASHYAPRTQTLMLATSRLKMQLRAFRQAKATQPTRCVITHSFDPEPMERLRVVRLAADAETWEYELYALLRQLDQERYGTLIVETPPDSPEWDAVNDRLRRATHGSSLDES